MAINISKPRITDGKVRYRADVTVKGKRVRSKWRKSKGQAKQDEVRIQHELFEGSYIDETQETFETFFIIYIEKVAPTRVSEAGIYHMRTLYNSQIKEPFGERLIASITAKEVQAFCTEKTGILSSSYIHQIYKLMKQIFDMCVRWEELKSSPLNHVILPRLEYKPFEVWNLQECKKFLEAVEDKYGYLAFRLAINTGMRLGECLGLHWEDIDFKRKTLSVNATLNLRTKKRKEPKTRASKRIIPLSDAQMKTLKKHKIEQRPFSNIVCVSPNGGYATHTHIREIMYKTIEEIGLKKIRFHDLRHTHATILVDNKANIKANIKAVQERLGHSSIKTTLDTYTHVTNKAAKETTAILSDLLNE